MKKKNVANNLYNKYYIIQMSILDSHCPSPKHEVGKGNSTGNEFLLFCFFFFSCLFIHLHRYIAF